VTNRAPEVERRFDIEQRTWRRGDFRHRRVIFLGRCAGTVALAVALAVASEKPPEIIGERSSFSAV
jgi:hypothetical protein